MSTERSHWRSHLVLATLIACVFSLVPFLMWGISAPMAKLGATILFVSTVVAYITAMKLSGVRLNFVSAEQRKRA